MLQVNSITVQGTNNRTLTFMREPGGITVVQPIVGRIGSITHLDLQDDVLEWTLPLLFGEPDKFGKFDCSDEDMRKLVSEIERLF